MKEKRGVRALWRKITMSVAAGILVGIIVTVCVVCSLFSRLITGFLMTGSLGEGTSVETLQNSEQLSHSIVEEGTVLLKNNEVGGIPALPLKTETKINVFGWGATDGGFVIGGSGSGDASEGDREFTLLLEALELAGFEYNKPLVQISTNLQGGREGESLTMEDRNTFFRLYEPVLTQTQMDQAVGFTDEVAIIVLSRLGGEGQDLPYYQYKKGATDTSRTYLQLSTEEERLIEDVKEADFNKVIVLLNTCNAMEVDFLNDDGIDAALSIGAVGQHGALGVANILRGSKEVEILDENEMPEFSYPLIITVVGVNGVGKTTAIGKLANKFRKQKKSVTIAAADTFRAAASDQLAVWADRADVRIVKHAEGADPGAVVFDAVSSFKSKNTDVLLIDTAGRLHNKKNLMEELKKITRIIAREVGEDSKAKVLNYIVLDATTGQNAISQVEVFNEAIDIDGIILTKLDGTAKGGVVLGISNELKVPVVYIGTGEGIDDIEEFDSGEFTEGIME